uniref:Uncharacterized protein n=1 Tax=Pseudomonas phage PACT201 TaxID=3230130 RepID=A0AAU8GSB6_9VIRU
MMVLAIRSGTAAWFSVMFGVVRSLRGPPVRVAGCWTWPSRQLRQVVQVRHPVTLGFLRRDIIPESEPGNNLGRMALATQYVRLTDVRGTDARRRKRDSPEVQYSIGFQVSLYKVEPRLRVLACNLLTKDFSRAALADEPGKMWPEMTRVTQAQLLRLPRRKVEQGQEPVQTGRVIWPAGAAKGERP